MFLYAHNVLQFRTSAIYFSRYFVPSMPSSVKKNGMELKSRFSDSAVAARAPTGVIPLSHHPVARTCNRACTL